jgi:hypothetical protein
MLRRRFSIFLLLASLGLVAGGSWMLLNQGPETSGDIAAVESALRSSNPAPPSTAPTTTPAPTAEPDPAVPDEVTAPAEVIDLAPPVGLRIEALGVDAPIAAYGVNQRTGQMAVPDNVTEVGWYQFGPAPGEAGSAVLAAHVDLAGSGPGVFFDLQSLEEGDRVVVLHTDGTESPFRVIARTTYEKDELPLDVVFSREGPSVLTLITCGGGFNTDISRYDSNVVVYAVPDLGNEPSEGSTL